MPEIKLNIDHDTWAKLHRDNPDIVPEPPKKALRVPFWATHSPRISVSEPRPVYNKGETLALHAGEDVTVYPDAKQSLQLARALIVGAMALEGVEAEPTRTAMPDDPEEDAGELLDFLDDLLAGLGERT